MSDASKILSLKDAPREQKIIIANKLHKEVGISIRKLAKMTGIPQKSVTRYLKINPEELETYDYWKQYDSALKKMWLEQDAEILAMAQKRIKEELPKAKLYQAIGAYKVVREANQSKEGTNINMQSSAMNVQVVRGNVSYNNNTPEESTE